MTETGYVRNYELHLPGRIDDSPVGRLLTGSIDMHLHFDPEPHMTRRQNALETALTAREAGMRGFVLKNRCYPTVALASLVSTLVPDIAVFGSVTLDYEVGGLNFHAVEAAGELGAKVVWMPAFCARNSKNIVAKSFGVDHRGEGISILDSNGKLVPEVDDIVKATRDYDMVLATGHISPREILALVDRCKQLGLTKIVVTHALVTIVMESILSADERRMLAREGVIIEHSAQEIASTGQRHNPDELADAIRDEGPEHCVMSTDFGATPHPITGEGMRLFISAMLKSGLSEEDIACMVKLNPARLLGL